MKTLLTTTALVAFLSAGPVFAADDTAPMKDPATQDMTTDAPAATDQMAPAPDATAPAVAADQDMSQTDTMAPDADTDTMATDQMAPAPDVAANNEVYIPTQASEEDLASNWIGKSLYNGNDENLGDINDILIGQGGNIRAVIVGVGGFLGIGEKDVAVSFNAIEPRSDEYRRRDALSQRHAGAARVGSGVRDPGRRPGAHRRRPAGGRPGGPGSRPVTTTTSSRPLSKGGHELAGMAPAGSTLLCFLCRLS